MKKKEAEKALNKLFEKIKKPVKNFVKSGGQEELHQFRIQVKKLKAMLMLCSAESKNQDLLKDFKPVKKALKRRAKFVTRTST